MTTALNDEIRPPSGRFPAQGIEPSPLCQCPLERNLSNSSGRQFDARLTGCMTIGVVEDRARTEGEIKKGRAIRSSQAGAIGSVSPGSG